MARLRRRVADAGKAAGARIALGLDSVFGSRAGDGFGVLYYHRVAEPPARIPSPTLNVTPTSFHRQVAGLLDRGFRFMSVGSVLALAQAGEPVPPRTAVITFDDGYRGVHRYAWPILGELGVPATVFLATSFIDTGRPFPFDPWATAHANEIPSDAWAPLTWDQCLEMTAHGLIEIGSHTHTHLDFRDRPGEFRTDLQTSLEAIHDRLGVSTTLLSFPFGNVRKGFAGEALVAEARRLGIRCGLTTEMALVRQETDPFRWGRFEGVGSDTGSTLRAKFDGWYTWMEVGRRLFQAV